MIRNNNDYVSFALAKKLKTAGFDEPCSHYYCRTKIPFTCPVEYKVRRLYNYYRTENHNAYDGELSAPSLWQAQKWLREKRNIDVLILNCTCGYVWDVSKAGDERTHGTSLIDYDNRGNDPSSGCWRSYESALSAGIEAAADYLLKTNQ